MNYWKEFLVPPGKDFRLEEANPDFHDPEETKESSLKSLSKLVEKMEHLQYLLYAEGRRSLLICLQALDGGGKDGTIEHVFGDLNPQGTKVSSFKVPSQEEASHDFLWRIHAKVPAAGQIGIFNRSHYEDVLVARVHNLVPKEVWQGRYSAMNSFEKNLHQSGTTILKFFLHISPQEQLERFAKRLEDPDRQWKISESDYRERTLWPEYTKAYQQALQETSTPHAPWFVIPANRKWFRNLAIATIVTQTLEKMDLKIPSPKVDLKRIRQKYHQAVASSKKL